MRAGPQARRAQVLACRRRAGAAGPAADPPPPPRARGRSRRWRIPSSRRRAPFLTIVTKGTRPGSTRDHAHSGV
eukprot:5210726-Pyramimonas_sp.AAC.1